MDCWCFGCGGLGCAFEFLGTFVLGLVGIDFVVGYGGFGVLECLIGSGLL